MSDHNTAIRMAQNLLTHAADGFREVEIGYHQFAPHPLARGYREAAKLIETLLIPEENIIRPTHLVEENDRHGHAAPALPLDPNPWTASNGRRYSAYGDIPMSTTPLWEPRSGYEQNRTQYPR